MLVASISIFASCTLQCTVELLKNVPWKIFINLGEPNGEPCERCCQFIKNIELLIGLIQNHTVIRYKKWPMQYDITSTNQFVYRQMNYDCRSLPPQGLTCWCHNSCDGCQNNYDFNQFNDGFDFTRRAIMSCLSPCNVPMATALSTVLRISSKWGNFSPWLQYRRQFASVSPT